MFNEYFIVLLVSNNPNCGAIVYAKENNINYEIINHFKYFDEISREKAFNNVLIIFMEG